MPRLVKGSDLTVSQTAEVLRAYIYRWTRENPHRTRVYQCSLCDVREPYVNEESANGHTHPTVPLQSDAEWLEEHAFWVNKDGSLTANRRGCLPAYMAEEEEDASLDC